MGRHSVHRREDSAEVGPVGFDDSAKGRRLLQPQESHGLVAPAQGRLLVHVDPCGSLASEEAIAHDVGERPSLLRHVRAGNGRARQVVERSRGGEAATPLTACPLTTPPLDAGTLIPRAHVPAAKPPFSSLPDAKHTKMGSGARRICDRWAKIPTQLRKGA